MKMRYPALFFVYIMVSACDTGTSFSGNTTTPPPAGGGPLTITSANAPAAMTVALKAALDSAGVGDVAGVIGVGTANVGNMNKVSGGDFYSATLVNAMQKVPFGPIEQPCVISGIITISGDLADPFAISFAVGDTLSVVAADCVDVPGETVNGTIDYLFTTITGDILLGPPYRLVFDVDLTNFQVADSTGTDVSNGSVTVSVDTTDPNLVWIVSINGTQLTIDGATGSDTISNFDTTETVDTLVVPTPYTLVSNGTVDSTDLEGPVDYSSPVMFEGSGEANPSTGEFLVTGASSSVRLIALDDVNVRLESDFDGDGVIDETTDTTWDALIAQAGP